MEAICQYCKQSFVPKRSDAIYCGASCRQMAHVLRKVVKDHLKVNMLNYPSIRNEINVLENNSKREASVSIAGSELLTDHERTNDEIYPSSSEKEISVNTDNLNYQSSFIKEIKSLITERDYTEALNDFNIDINPMADWLSLRYRCLVECLLNISEMRSVELDDLKEVCNAFTHLINSRSFQKLDSDYPYAEEILKIREQLKNFCLKARQDQRVTFQFKRETKIKMLATRWELANFTPRITFSQLDFKE